MVYVACKDNEEAEKISNHLLKKRLIACANTFPVKSIYRWKNKINKDNEIVVLAKSLKEKRQDIIKDVKAIHSYDVPCIEFFETSANKEYESWVKEETK